MAFLASKETAEARMAICKDCPSFQSFLRTCAECGCFMPAKVRLPNVECPLKKWGVAGADAVVEEKDVNVKYKVLAASPGQGSALVRYFTDILGEDELAIERDQDGKIKRCRFDLNITVMDTE